MARIRITQLGLHGIPGKRYGNFSGKAVVTSAVPFRTLLGVGT